MSARRRILVFGLILASVHAWASLAPGKNEVMLRGRAEDIYYYPAGATPVRGHVFFAPGDGGWHGFAIVIAKAMSGWGYDVYGLDTRRYLSSFVDQGGLTEAQVASDFAQLALSTGTRNDQRTILLGWSEGAGLALVAAAAPENKCVFAGLVTLGLPERGFLAWRWQDSVTYVTRQLPKEPTFSNFDFIAKVSPLPLFMIQSTQDEFVPMNAAQRLFEAAREPRRFRTVAASDHRFGGNQDGFFSVLREALQWIQQPSR